MDMEQPNNVYTILKIKLCNKTREQFKKDFLVTFFEKDVFCIFPVITRWFRDMRIRRNKLLNILRVEFKTLLFLINF